MTTLRRASVGARILDLTQRLAEDYDAIPLPEVSRVVQEAAAATSRVAAESTSAAGINIRLEQIERIARGDLDWMCADQARRPRVRLESAGRARSAGHPRGRHLGVASLG